MKVFLSSTYIDLIEHRKAAHDALERLGQEVGRMEIFGARAEEATNAALAQLEKCDLVVGIYAYRYGFIPEGSDISITEQEYVHAKSKGKPVLCFVVNEEYPWSPKMMEKDAGKIKKLEDFKAKVLKEKVVDFFTTPDDLGMKIATSVHNYLEEHKPDSESSSSINHSSQKPRSSTLPTQPYFFGRVNELKIIAAALSPDSRTWGALIDGPGGIGKTALAIEAALRAPKENFEHKFFITAKVRELTASGEKLLTDFTRPNYLEMINELALQLGEDGIPRLAPEERTKELWNAMRGKKVLVVLDNLETLSEDERTRLFQFLSRLPEGNKAIVTSRRRADADARVIRLDRLSADEALLLMAELAKNNPRLARENEKAYRELYEITYGNPLLIKWVCGQLGREGSAMHTITDACKFIENVPKDNDPLEYIFGDLLGTFSESETKVLAALTHFTQPANLKWIIDMTGLTEQVVEIALEDLTDRSILISNPEALKFYLPPLAVQFIKTRHPDIITQTGNALADRAYALIVQNGGSGNYEGFSVLDAEWTSIMAAMPYLFVGNFNRFHEVFDALHDFLNITGRWDESVILHQQSEKIYLAHNHTRDAGWQAFHMLSVYLRREQATEALSCITRIESYWQNERGTPEIVCKTIHGHFHMLEKNYSLAIKAFKEALDINRRIFPEEIHITHVLGNLAEAEEKFGDYAAAECDYSEALRISQKNYYLPGIIFSNIGLADLALDQKRWTDAERLSTEALRQCEQTGDMGDIASSCINLAKSLKEQGRLIESIPYARRAVEIFTRLRYKDLHKAQELLTEIENVISYQ